MKRRELLGSLAAAFLAAQQDRCDQPEIRLAVDVRPPARPALAAGRHAAGEAGARRPWIHVPAGFDPGVDTPLLILLHGAGQSSDLFAPMTSNADAHGVVLLVPNSAGRTWDGIGGRFGRDVAGLGRVLEWTIERVRVDPGRLCIGGFSDGASYALGLGLANGDLFTHVMALSPGFIPSRERTGRPRLFITHGTQDAILPIDRTSRTLVRALENAGYPVEYHEFDGPHTMPPRQLEDAFAWLAGGTAGRATRRD